MNDAFTIYEARVAGREVLDGQPVLVATLEPRQNVDAKTREGKWMKKFHGKIWASESDYQIARIEADVIDDVTYGWGILARLHKGTRAEFVRRKVNGEVWLPARETIHASGRSLLFRKFKLDTETTYSDYRKFEVSTGERFGQGH